ncbi:MAG: FtsX-like permease family protein [Bacteroidetes bacterium]|jgi:putative ABC transport system permease protein|nr:FtsX-like permease family protein [Bacteroidota bacterium]
MKLKIAFRNLFKNKVDTFISMSGLAIGIAVFFLITMYSSHELSYDKFNSNYKDIYQVNISEGFYTAAPLANLMKESIPELRSVTRIDYFAGGGQAPFIEVDENGSLKKVKVKNVVFADNNFFDLFSFKVIHGNPTTALNNPYSIVLTRNTSQLLFGTDNSVGKSIHYIGDRSKVTEMDMMVSAVIENIPDNSSITFNAVASFATLNSIKPTGNDMDSDWSNWMYSTFSLLDNQNSKIVEEKLSKLWKECESINFPDSEHQEIGIVSLSDIPFYNNNKRQLIFLIQLVGIFILILALVNFINLTIARSSLRAKEIAIRKVTGSSRFELIKQFLFESILISILVAPVSLLIVWLSKSYFINITNTPISLEIIHQPLLIVYFVIGILIIGIIAGIYPAFYLSSFKITPLLKGELTKGKKRNSLQFGLFVFQFVISISLIICTVIISKQIDFVKDKSLGLNTANIIDFNQSPQVGSKYDIFKQRLLDDPNIISVTRTNTGLGKGLPITGTYEDNGIKKSYSVTTVDPDFVPTMDIGILDGRNFSWEIQSDKIGALIVNETFVEEFGLETVLDTEITLFKQKVKIIGVAKDFFYDSFHQKLKPSALWYVDWNSHINIKINNQNTVQSIKHIEGLWNEFSPQIPFEYEILDETYGQLYEPEENLQKIFATFSLIAIIIACLGLFGLALNSTQRRVKEISIRKINGAKVSDILMLLNKNFTKWIVIAFVIACPIAWYAMHEWLNNYAYKTELSLWIFAIAGILALGIALLTVSFLSWKAASRNPVEGLRNE